MELNTYAKYRTEICFYQTFSSLFGASGFRAPEISTVAAYILPEIVTVFDKYINWNNPIQFPFKQSTML